MSGSVRLRNEDLLFERVRPQPPLSIGPDARSRMLGRADDEEGGQARKFLSLSSHRCHAFFLEKRRKAEKRMHVANQENILFKIKGTEIVLLIIICNYRKNKLYPWG
jgi:hypothetical protein